MLCGLIAESEDGRIVFAGAHYYDKTKNVFENMHAVSIV